MCYSLKSINTNNSALKVLLFVINTNNSALKALLFVINTNNSALRYYSVGWLLKMLCTSWVIVLVISQRPLAKAKDLYKQWSFCIVIRATILLHHSNSSRDARRRPARFHCSKGTGRRLANWSELPKTPLPSSLPPNCTCSVCIVWVRLTSTIFLDHAVVSNTDILSTSFVHC